MTPTHYSIAIVGGGVIGCALAATLARRGNRVVLLEKESSPGLHASGRNSGVVHSGFNPKPGTLKARLCVDGNRRIADYAQSQGIPYRQVGTLVVARSEAEHRVLETLLQNGVTNGVPGIEIISGESLRKREPNALGDAALYAPSGGIIDSGALVRSLADQAQKEGATFLFNHPVAGAEEQKDHVKLKIGSKQMTTDFLVNCAGLHADVLAHAMGVGSSYAIIPFRGEYYEVCSDTTPLITSMVYPAPDLAFPFLGVHLTSTTDGRVLIGPNAVPALGREAYSRFSFNWREMAAQAAWKGTRALLKSSQIRRMAGWEIRRSFSKRIFAAEASEVVRGIEARHLHTYRPGIRAQLVSETGQLVEDMILERTAHSLHLLNVVSPGMTCSLPFAEFVADRIQELHH